MAFNILDIMNAATKAEAGQNRDYQDIVVNYRDIVVTKHNKYSMDELQEIATGIEMDGLQQPPCIRPCKRGILVGFRSPPPGRY